MADKFNTAFQIHHEIYNTRNQIEKKNNEYDEHMKKIETLNIESDMFKNNINEINTSINSLNNFLEYNCDNSNRFSTLSIKNEYILKLQELKDELSYVEYNISNIENELKKLYIEFKAYYTYIDNLYKMIPRINRWGNIKNMTPYELEIETYQNKTRFEIQLSILNFHPPQLERS